MIVTGRRMPALAGMVASVRTLTAKNTAECVIGATALMLPRRCGEEPAKSSVSRSGVTSTRSLTSTGSSLLPSSSRQSCGEIGARRQLGDAVAHAPLGIVEDRRETLGQHARAVALRQLAQSPLADADRRQLGIEITAPLRGACAHWP